jgi:hypothetical protein
LRVRIKEEERLRIDVTGLGEVRNPHKLLVRMPEEKNPLSLGGGGKEIFRRL